MLSRFVYIVLRVKSSLNSRNTSLLFSNILKLIIVKSCYKFQEQKCSYVTSWESRQHQTSSFTNAQFSAIQPVTLPTQQNDIWRTNRLQVHLQYYCHHHCCSWMNFQNSIPFHCYQNKLAARAFMCLPAGKCASFS